MNCVECHENMAGRTDKKFCSDHCRNAFNNRKYRNSESIVREVNRILKLNRRILREMHHAGKRAVSESNLIEKGFRLNYTTGYCLDDQGSIQFNVYDHALRHLGRREYELLQLTEVQTNEHSANDIVGMSDP
ncbi:MAG: hypothetical protein RIC15_02585 [Vicingaceae bacterium]